MADRQSNAPSRAEAGASTTGVIHVRTRLTADFTVLSNALAQRRGSAVTIGVAAYILSLPDGSPVSISALCAHFSEGEIVISRALRELAAEGYLERPRVRLPSGRIRTQTYFHDVPHRNRDPRPDGPQEQPKPTRPRRSRRAPAPVGAAGSTALTRKLSPAQSPVPAQREPEEPVSLADADPAAVAVLASLRRVDPRLVLSEREAAPLVPGIGRWLTAGMSAHRIAEVLTARLPDRFLTRPAAILAFRLRETPLPAPPPLAAAPPSTRRPAVPPWQTCDGCERAFRAPEPGHCRDCRSVRRFHVVG